MAETLDNPIHSTAAPSAAAPDSGAGAPAAGAEAQGSTGMSEAAVDSAFDRLHNRATGRQPGSGNTNAAKPANDDEAQGDDAGVEMDQSIDPAAPDGDDQTAGEIDESKPEANVLTAAEQQVLARCGFEADDLPTDPVRRLKVMANLADRVRYDDGLAPQIAELQRRLGNQPPPKPQQQQQRQQDPPPGEDQELDAQDVQPWLDAVGGDERIGRGLAGAVQTVAGRIAQRQMEPILQQNAQLHHELNQVTRFVQAMHAERGFEKAAAEAPEGVNLDDPKARKQVLDVAWNIIKGKALEEGFSVQDYNLSHAIPEAAGYVFRDQSRAAAEKAKAQNRKRALAGTPSPAAASSAQKAPLDEDAALDETFERMRKAGGRGPRAVAAGQEAFARIAQ